MSTLITPARLVERTTTVTREYFIAGPSPSADRGESGSHDVIGPSLDEDARTLNVVSIGRMGRTFIRIGGWLITLGRRRAHRPPTDPAEIARRVDSARGRDLARFHVLPF